MSRKVIVLFLIYLQSQGTVSQLVEASFRSAGIVSDVIDRAPSDLLEVSKIMCTIITINHKFYSPFSTRR